MPAQQIDVEKVIEAQGATGFQVRLMIWISLAMLVEGYDMQVVGYAAPAMIRDWHISKASFGAVFGLGMAGYMLGALVLSTLGDRIGRRAVVIAGVFVFGALTVAGAGATSTAEMTWLRILAGIGLGGAIPNVIALAAEYAPAHVRATRVAIAFAAYTIGSAAGGFIAAYLLPRYGWPSLFYVGGWGALLLAVALLFALPDSARFLVGRKRGGARLLRTMQRLAPSLSLNAQTVFVVTEERREPGSVLELFRDGFLPVTLLLWAAYIFNMVALHFLTSWLPTVLDASGAGMANAAVATGLLQGGGTVGSLLSGHLLDRRGIGALALLFLLAVPVLLGVGAASGSVGWSMGLIAVAGLCIPGGQCGINALAGTLYPTAIRSTGAGWALGIGRIGSILGPGLGGILLALELPYQALFAILAVAPLLTSSVLGLLARATLTRSQFGGLIGQASGD